PGVVVTSTLPLLVLLTLAMTQLVQLSMVTSLSVNVGVVFSGSPGSVALASRPVRLIVMLASTLNVWGAATGLSFTAVTLIVMVLAVGEMVVVQTPLSS